MRTSAVTPCFFLLVALVILSGCTTPASTDLAKPTPAPQIVYVTVLVTPTPALVIPTPATESVRTDIPYHTSTRSSTGSSSPLTISGYGDDTISFSVTGGGRFLVTGSNAGYNYFIVHVVDDEDEIEEFVFNKFGLGPFSGRTIIQLDPGTHYLDVRAEGPWTITLSRI